MAELFALLFLSFPEQGEEAALPAAGTYRLDKSHASPVFTVSHVGFSNYTMRLDTSDATPETDLAHPKKASLKASIEPRSVDLPNPPESFTDTMLIKDWLNAGASPQITSTSPRTEMTGEKEANVHGQLELLGVKKPVVLKTVFNGGYAGHPMDPQARIGFSVTGSFSRFDFAMTYGIPEPGTTMGVGDLVHADIEAEFSGPPLEETKHQQARTDRHVYKYDPASPPAACAS